MRLLKAVVVGGALLSAAPLHAQVDTTLINAMRWRNIGPANMSGRIVDVEGIPSPSRTFYVSTAGGGLWKTSNGGVTFRPVLDTARVVSGGDLAIAPSDTNTVYYGTGEPNSRNSISPGGGIYKTTDGGRSWKFLGLAETRQIGRVQVHPRDPNTVWVAALGHTWGPNKERGVYKTTDGGTTWRLVKFVSDKAGFVDLQLDPRDPNVIWASSYERVRGPYSLMSGGPGSALWKSTDGGETWTEVKAAGLPTSRYGRIEIAISPSSPDVMYLQIEADTNPNTTRGQAPQRRPSGLYRSEDGGRSFKYMSPENVRPFYYSQVRVHPTKPNRVWWSSTPVKYSNDGGATAGNATAGLHVDHHAMWIDPKDPERMIVGNDGGIGITFDGGGNYIFPNTFAIGQFYNISFDMAVPYRVCGGLQDNGSWCGPSRRRQGAITNAMWHNVGGGDGFVTQQDYSDPNIIYSTSQGGNMGRLDFALGQRTSLRKPTFRDTYGSWDDSIAAVRGSSTTLTPAQTRRITELRMRQKNDSTESTLRWNWNTPYIISKHNPQVLYFGANRVLKSVKRGDEMFPISGDLTTRDSLGIYVATTTTGGITRDVTGAEMFSTIVSLNESPLRQGVLYAGTDDGKVWISMNDGGAWTDLSGRFPGVPAGSYVSRIEPSSSELGTFYVTFDNHRRDDYTPYVYMTTDNGRTFKSIASNLPTGGPDFVHVIREDLRNPELLFVGTDVGVYVSTNRGGAWQRFMSDLPSVPVHDLIIHPRDNELVAGTHGRSIWIVDITPLQQFDAQVATKAAHLFAPRTAFQWGESTINGGSNGHLLFQSPSPQYGADIWYHLARPAGGPVSVVVTNGGGDVVANINGPNTAGLHRVSWNYSLAPRPPVLTVAQRRDSLSQAIRMSAVLDSLERNNVVPKASIDAVRGFMARSAAPIGGGGRGGAGGGGGRGGAGSDFVERPGETIATASFPTGGAPGGGRGAGGGGGGGGGQQAAVAAAIGIDPAQLQTIAAALGPNANLLGGGGGFGGGGFGGGGATAGTGEYGLSLTVGGVTQKQTLRVVNVGVGGTNYPADR
jgi:hypothetical protein